MKALLLTLAAGIAISTSAANAAVILIDDFSFNQGPLSDQTRNGIARTTGPVVITSGPNMFRRTLSINLLQRRAPIQDQIIVANGELDISNGTGERTEARVIYDDIENLNDDLPDNITDLAFSFLVIESDANPVNIELLLNGASLGDFDIAPNTFNQVVTFGVNPNIVFDGVLEFIVNGSLGYDVAFGDFNLIFNQDDVPAPGMLGLFGLGLVALGARRRRA